jgi:hypothetical protein
MPMINQALLLLHVSFKKAFAIAEKCGLSVASAYIYKANETAI